MPPGTHGGDIISTAGELGCNVSDLIDMSSNLTPLATTEGLKDRIISRLDEIGFLPETGSEALCSAFAKKYGLAVDQILAGNGTTEFIFALPRALSPKRTVIVNPTYADYHLACNWAGIPVTGFTLSPDNGFVPDLDALAATLTGGELVCICNPNNPTGVLIPSDDLYALANGRKKSIFLIDESYLPFCRERSLLTYPVLDNMFILTSFSKIYGIPGLRLGFLTASEKNMRLMGERRKPWGVNRMAQVAGEYLLERADPYVEKVITFLEQKRGPFTEQLDRMPGVEVVPGMANFILSRLTGKIRAGELRERLLKHRIMIRNCENFVSLDDHFFRVSLKSDTNNDFFLKTLGKILCE